MVETQKISVQETKKSRLSEVDFNHLPFGKEYSDHMFMADFKHGEWGNLRVMPYGHLSVSPATPAIHYGQSIFEGLKAYKNEIGQALIFRPLDNWKRMNFSADRMCMANIPEEIFMEGMRTNVGLADSTLRKHLKRALDIGLIASTTDSIHDPHRRYTLTKLGQRQLNR